VSGDLIVGLGASPGDCSLFPPIQGKFDFFLWDGTSWVLKSSAPVDGSDDSLGGGSLLKTFDLTGDEILEVILTTTCVKPLVVVYSVGSQGSFELAVANSFEYPEDGEGYLGRFYKNCEPTCADSGVEQYQLVWNGQKFDEVLTERFLPTVAGSNYSGKDLSRFNMSEWDWTGADLNGSNLRGANLANSNLSGVNLSGADLTGANLSGANLSNAKLGDANLSNANLRAVDLRGAFTLYTNFGGVDFLNANITGVNFESANLTGAIMPDGSLFVPDPDYDPMADGCDGDC